MHGKLHRRKGRVAVSRGLKRQNGVINKMKTNRPMQMFVAFVKPALDQIANHGKQFVEVYSLRRHFRLMANRNKRFLILFDFKNELFLHDLSLVYEMDFDKTACEKLKYQRKRDRVCIRRAKSLMGN
jgi:hypothetical protein